MKTKSIAAFLAILVFSNFVWAQSEPVKIGIATILSGDLAIVGDNARKSVEAYQALFPNPRMKLIFEDARLTSMEGLRAYEKLIKVDKVHLAIAACTSNGTMAASALFQSAKTPVVSVSTGGSNIDNAGEYVFRIGNSDSLNGVEQANYFAAP